MRPKTYGHRWHLEHPDRGPVPPLPAQPQTDKLLIDEAWGLIANVGHGNWQTQDAGWQEAALAWAKKYVDRNKKPTDNTPR